MRSSKRGALEQRPEVDLRGHLSQGQLDSGAVISETVVDARGTDGDCWRQYRRRTEIIIL